MVSDDDIIKIRRLLQLRTADMVEKNLAQSLIQKYINPGAKYCMTCDPAVRQMFKTLRNWAESNGIVKTNN